MITSELRSNTVNSIDVYADIWCPFAHLALRSIVRRRDALGRNDVVVRERAWPLELVNGRPLDPLVTAGHADELRAQVAPDLFAHLDPQHFPTTSLPALALAAAAYRRGDATGEAVSFALRDALFEQGRNIANPEVLASIAKAHGVGHPDLDDDETVRREWKEGIARGVEGSPHFFCGDVDAFCPSLDIAKDDEGHLHVLRNMKALDAFLGECFQR